MKTPHQPKDDAYAKAVAVYGVSYMSDAKWVRLFNAIIDAEIDLPFVRISYIDWDRTTWKRFPRRSDVLPERFADGATYEPFEYKWIESIFIPREFTYGETDRRVRSQDVAAVEAALHRVGRFCLELDEQGLTIWAYGDKREDANR